MAYTKQTWVTGDVVTAEKLNHIENGIFNTAGVLYIPVTVTETSTPGGETSTFTFSSDYSYDDITEAVAAGKFPIVTTEVNRNGVSGTLYLTLVQSFAETEVLYGAFGFMDSIRSGYSLCFNSDGTIDTQTHEKQAETGE